MLHMVDTDICNYIMRRQPASVVRAFQNRIDARHGICMSVVTWFELRSGVESKGESEGRKFSLQIRDLLETFNRGVVWWDFECERRFAALSASYVREYPRSNFGNIRNDVMIASHALALGAVVVTNNERDFARIRRIGGPVWENWVSDV